MTFPNDESAVKYLEEEIASALPEGWTSHRRLQYRYEQVPEAEVTLAQMEWKVAPAYEPRELPSRDYLVHLSADRKVLAVVHGNSDAGGSVFHWMMQKATLIHVQDLQYHSFRTFLKHLLATEPPNRRGLS